MPGLVIAPSAVLTNEFGGLAGSIFGTIHGFTHLGWTGVTAPEVPLFSDAEGLNTSAVAVALTEFPVLPQMREKNVGSAVRWIRTVTSGLMAKAAVWPE